MSHNNDDDAADFNKRLIHYLRFMYATLHATSPNEFYNYIYILKRAFIRDFNATPANNSVPLHLLMETYHGTINDLTEFYERGISLCPCRFCVRCRQTRMRYNALSHTLRADSLTAPNSGA